MARCCSDNIVVLPSFGKQGKQGRIGDQGPVGDTGADGADGATGGQEVYQAEKIVFNALNVPNTYNGALVSSANPYPATILTQAQLESIQNSGLLKNIFYLNGAGLDPSGPFDIKYNIWYTYGGVASVPCRDAKLLGYVNQVYIDPDNNNELRVDFTHFGNYRMVILG